MTNEQVNPAGCRVVEWPNIPNREPDRDWDLRIVNIWTEDKATIGTEKHETTADAWIRIIGESPGHQKVIDACYYDDDRGYTLYSGGWVRGWRNQTREFPIGSIGKLIDIVVPIVPVCDTDKPQSNESQPDSDLRTLLDKLYVGKTLLRDAITESIGGDQRMIDHRTELLNRLQNIHQQAQVLCRSLHLDQIGP